MKNEIRLALLCMAVASAPAFAQNALPSCAETNFNQARNEFTIVNPAVGATNQQCYLTVFPNGATRDTSYQYPTPHLTEGSYNVELVGGGGGGGGGGAMDKGGGGGGAGAAPLRAVRYLAPGVYKLTIGTGGEGGGSNGGRSGDGNPTSLTNANTGELIAGFAGADVWQHQTVAASDGHGGAAKPGGSTGGSGGDSGTQSEEKAQAGGSLPISGYAGVPGQAGSESGRTGKTEDGRNIVQSNAGGGGGASVGSGATGESAGANTVAQAGSKGGDGFIRLSLNTPAPKPVAPAAAPAAATRVEAAPVPAAALPARKARN